MGGLFVNLREQFGTQQVFHVEHHQPRQRVAVPRALISRIFGGNWNNTLVPE
jgi:hypothetical protein